MLMVHLAQDSDSNSCGRKSCLRKALKSGPCPFVIPLMLPQHAQKLDVRGALPIPLFPHFLLFCFLILKLFFFFFKLPYAFITF